MYPPRIQLPTHPPRMQLPIHPPRMQLPAHPPRMQIPTHSPRVQVSPTIHPPRVQVSPNPPRVQPRHLSEFTVDKIFAPRVQPPTYPPRVQVPIHSPRMQFSPLLPQRPSPIYNHTSCMLNHQLFSKQEKHFLLIVIRSILERMTDFVQECPTVITYAQT